MSTREQTPSATSAPWTALISDEEWAVYAHALQVARQAGVPFLLGGAFGLAVYTNRWRDTKDLDLLVRPQDRQKFIDALTAANFDDYYPRLAYDRGWIYRSVRQDFIVDVIWQMANRRAQIDDLWFEHATPFEIRGQSLGIVPAEELLWHKLYVMQRERCDWPDVLNLLRTSVTRLDWARLLERIGPDALLFSGLLQVFIWLCPGHARSIPEWVCQKLRLPQPDSPILEDPRRIQLLDSRPWFGLPQERSNP